MSHLGEFMSNGGWRALVWALACLTLGVAATPLCLRVFRGLADRGAGLVFAAGVAITSFIAWLLAYPYIGEGRLGLSVRATIFSVAAASAFAATMLVTSRHRALSRFLPAGIFAFIALVHLPHTSWSVVVAATLLALLSHACWVGDAEGLRRAIRRAGPDLVFSAVLFLVGFIGFAWVRSFLPWATFDIGLYGAEKTGNFMHLNSMMNSRVMPPQDAWFLGEPTNYYYGGHLLVATLAKLTGTPARIAFNLGIATIVGLTFSAGASFVFNAVRRVRVRGTMTRPFRFSWNRGRAWALVGALAITCFGNIDAWQQLFSRDPEMVRTDVEIRLSNGDHPVREISTAELRWMPENLRSIDFWRSSRAIKGAPPEINEAGTITEFPYFSAILGDMHPHHMALPFTLLALSACLCLLRRVNALRPTRDGDWWKLAATPLLAMGFCIGAVFPVNIWDTVVLVGVYMLVVLHARRGIDTEDAWRWVAFAAMTLIISWVGALITNAHVGAVVAFPSLPHFAMALFLGTFAPLLLAGYLPGASAAMRFLGPAIVAAFVLWFPGHESAVVGEKITGDPHSSLRDPILFLASLALAWWWTMRGESLRMRWIAAAGSAYAVPGVLALLVAMPFRRAFRSPLEVGAPPLEHIFPPMVSGDVMANAEGSFVALWNGLPIKPLDSAIRTDLTDFFVHWGIFLVPILVLVCVRLNRWKSTLSPGRWFAFAMACAMVFFTAFNMMVSWTGPFTALLALVLGVIVFNAPRAATTPALVLMCAAMVWCLFCEVLYFDDNMVGFHERYNTVFKIYYPLWPMFAAGAVLAIRELTGACLAAPRRLIVQGALVAMFLVAGLFYTYAATMRRTHSFFADSRAMLARDRESFDARYARGHDPEFATVQTLDAIAWLEQTPEYKGDLAAIEWLMENTPRDAVILEAPSSGAYTPSGRVSAMSGRRTMVGWPSHENQWRGWGVPIPRNLAIKYFDMIAPMLPPLTDVFAGFPSARVIDRDVEIDLYRKSLTMNRDEFLDELAQLFPEIDAAVFSDFRNQIIELRSRMMSNVTFTSELAARMALIYRAPRFTRDIVDTLKLFNVRYVFVGTIEQAEYSPTGIAKFSAFKLVYENGNNRIYEIDPATLDQLLSDREETP
jgi:uncharacterized membrane protein